MIIANKRVRAREKEKMKSPKLATDSVKYNFRTYIQQPALNQMKRHKIHKGFSVLRRRVMAVKVILVHRNVRVASNGLKIHNAKEKAKIENHTTTELFEAV